jgi:hypothetical protein
MNNNSPQTVEEPCHQALLVALEQNWLHARHQEYQRFWLLNVYVAITTAIAWLIFTKGFYTFISTLLLLFLTAVSLSVFFTLLKMNAEFANHIAAIQWIAEKLRLIIKLDNANKKRIMFKGYMALPLPLPIRAHEVFFTWLPLCTTTIILALLVYNVWNMWSKIFQIIKACPPPIIISVCVIAPITACLLWIILEKVFKKKAKDLLDGRKPDEIKIKYE